MTGVSLLKIVTVRASGRSGADYFIVGHLLTDLGTTFNKLEIWLNPSTGDATTPDATATLGADLTIGSFLNLGLRTANLDSNDRLYLDELTIGMTFGDVIPIPEPGTLALFGLGLAGLGIARRRKAA